MHCKADGKNKIRLVTNLEKIQALVVALSLIRRARKATLELFTEDSNKNDRTLLQKFYAVLSREEEDGHRASAACSAFEPGTSANLSSGATRGVSPNLSSRVRC